MPDTLPLPVGDVLAACPHCKGRNLEVSWIETGFEKWWHVLCNGCQHETNGDTEAQARAEWQKCALPTLRTRSPVKLVGEGYVATAFVDLANEIDKIDPEFPNYGDWPVTLTAGHWRAIFASRNRIAATDELVAELREALEPFIATKHSDYWTTITVPTKAIANARALLNRTGGQK